MVPSASEVVVEVVVEVVMGGAILLWHGSLRLAMRAEPAWCAVDKGLVGCGVAAAQVWLFQQHDDEMSRAEGLRSKEPGQIAGDNARHQNGEQGKTQEEHGGSLHAKPDAGMRYCGAAKG